MDSNYQVILLDKNGHDVESVFQGSMADCEAYIRLHEGGYFDQ